MRGELTRRTGKANRVWRVRFSSAKKWKMRGSRKRSRGEKESEILENEKLENESWENESLKRESERE